MTHLCKCLLFMALLGNCCFLITACNKSAAKLTNVPLVLSNSYEGYRLELVNMEAVEEKDGIKISGTLINTGRNKISLPYKEKNNLVINFDNSLKKLGLSSLTKEIQYAILKQEQTLEPGQIASSVNFKIKSDIEISAPSIEDEFVSKGNDFPENACSDLKIDTFFVSKRSKKYIEISFKIINIGKGSAPLFGETKEIEDNVAIRAYASGTEKLSRGDIILGGAYIESGTKDKNGILHPNESFAGAFKVDIRKKTRYMPYLIISIDDYQNLWECDEGNNVKKMLYR